MFALRGLPNNESSVLGTATEIPYVPKRLMSHNAMVPRRREPLTNAGG